MSIKYGAMSFRTGQPSNEEVDLCKLLVKLEAGPLGRGYKLARISGTVYDTWNLYYDGECVFGVQETDDGYAITYTLKECIPDVLRYIETLR